jgi:hypothetical protein
MAKGEEARGVGTLLSTVIGNVAAVSVVLGLVALGGAVIVGRSVADLAVPRSRRRSRRRQSARRHESAVR